jgi:TPR repeat protein
MLFSWKRLVNITQESGVPQDYERALTLFSSLALKGNAESARFIGLML